MKRILLSASAVLLSLGFAQAQLGWTTTGAHDDFHDSPSPYVATATAGGLYWFELTGGDTLALSRTAAVGTTPGFMSVAATTAGGCNATTSPTNYGKCYPIFGVNFGDNGATPTATPYYLNLSSGANIVVDIENTVASGAYLAYMSIQVQDANGHISDIEPNVSDVKDTSTYGYAGPPTNHYRRKALNGFTLTPHTRKTITIDLSSVPGVVGGLTAGTYNCAPGPYTCPVTSYTLDITKIKAILFQVNFGKDDINISEGDGDPTSDTFIAGTSISTFSGTFKIRDFRIGSAAVAGVSEATVVDNSLKIYPNPAKENITVDFTSMNGATISLTDLVGNQVFSTSVNAGDNQTVVNTSNLSTGMYILNVATENGRVARKVSIK